MNCVKRFAGVLALVGLVAFGVYSLSVPAYAEDNGGPKAADITLSNASHGVVFATAGINADGTIANGFNVNKTTTLHLTTGTYQVGFANFGNGAITANNGYWRWVQPDTLTIDTLQAYCITADRVGVTTAIWVECYGWNGTAVVPTDTSFFLYVAH